MSDTKHTPGPWEYVEYPNGPIEVIAGGDVGGVVHQGQIFTEPDDIAEERANARLIAAAPELLAACKELTTLVENISNIRHAGLTIWRGHWAALYDNTNKAKAVIAAAEKE